MTPAPTPLPWVPGSGNAPEYNFTAAIREETVRGCTERYGKELRAVVLIGSLARDEATVVRGDAVWKLLGDADFYLLFNNGAKEPDGTAIEAVSREIEGALLRRGLACKISLSVVKGKYFETMPRHILTYEVRMCGLVVWGDREVLSRIPRFAPEEISLEDAWRLLANRIVEHLGTMAETRDSCSPQLRYSIVKLYLDMATSFLVFAQRYEPTYCSRERALRTLATGSSDSRFNSFPLRVLADRVTVCTRFKLDSEPLPDSTEDLLRDAQQCASSLWDWELSQLIGQPVSNHVELLTVWMQRQPLRVRILGWASVVRHSGGLRSWPQWIRWAGLARTASPRYWVYSVAAQAFFQKQEPAERALALAQKLPFSGNSAPQHRMEAWQRLSELTAANYSRFLESTIR